MNQAPSASKELEELCEIRKTNKNKKMGNNSPFLRINTLGSTK